MIFKFYFLNIRIMDIFFVILIFKENYFYLANQCICPLCLKILNILMRFRHFDSLRVFSLVAQHASFSTAAKVLNLTKGAVSYHIRQLEGDLGFSLFRRVHGGVSLTEKGAQLLQASDAAFRGLEETIRSLKEHHSENITIGLSTYFASRWLSPRLMTFMDDHPGIRLLLLPLVDFTNLDSEGIDVAIRWGDGEWSDLTIEPLFNCPAFPTCNRAVYDNIRREGLEAVLEKSILLNDRKGSTAWSEWHEVAGLPFGNHQETLVIPDPNVRVQAVIDGQGIALNDALIRPEIEAGLLFQVSEARLENYGYHLAYSDLAYSEQSGSIPELMSFRDWIMKEASSFKRMK